MAEIGDPQKLFEHELGMALGAERKVLTTLRKLEQNAQRQELKQQFHHHLEETEGQIENLEQAFMALGARAGGHEADSANGIAAEGEKLMGKVDEELIDAVPLGAAADRVRGNCDVRGLITTPYVAAVNRWTGDYRDTHDA